MPTKAIRKNKKILVLLWIIFNTLWVVALVPAFLTLNVFIINHVNSNWLKYFICLLIFGILQGLLISIFQGIILWFYKLPLKKIARLSLANIVGVSSGILIFGMCFGKLVINDNGLILLLILHLSLFITGFLWGLTAGVDRFQKVNWAIATGIAYPLWSLAHMTGGIFYTSPLPKHNPVVFYCGMILIVFLYGIGFYLTIPKVINLLNKYQNS